MKNGERKHESLEKMRAFWQVGTDPESQEMVKQLLHMDGEYTALENTRSTTGKRNTTQKYKSWLPEGTWTGLRNMQGLIRERNKHIFWQQAMIQLFQTGINVLYPRTRFNSFS